MGERSAYRAWAVVLGVLATVLFALAVAVYYGYIPTSFVNNFTSTELGFFGVLAAIGAVGVEIMGYRNNRG
jgi:predicted MFS family arabinose efflux permease